MILLLLLLPLTAVALVCVLPRGATASRWHRVQGRMRLALRYRVQRVRLPHDWWEQFEREFAAYVDPRATRAREQERS
jgi:hypothetical protein